ncbi:MAG: hypothetical protein IAF58_17305, partial [Leptolyngbya sp.]|nr:hypothetical protein [Candidatus Melainabacteria bacterium]
QELRIGGGTDIRSKDSSKFNPEIQKSTDSERYEKLGVAEICCVGNMLIEGPFSQDGKIYGKRSREGYSNILPLPENLKSPCSALAIPAATKTLDSSKNVFPNIDAGDYVADAQLIAQKFNLKNTGRVRIFLEDTPPDATNYILNLRTNHFARATNLQIWYRGTKTIVVDEDTCAVIYAPDATVQISSGKEFTGAIVANRIIVEGNSRLRFDKSLLSEVFF